MTETELVRAAAQGDENAFAQLVRMYEQKAYHLALRMCSNPEDASDVAQDARVLTFTSPKDSESFMAPIPKESRTIKKIRFIGLPQYRVWGHVEMPP